MIKNYVISLTTANQRRNHIIQEFGKQGINFVFFDAVTPSQVDSLAQKMAIRLDNAPLSDGEKACLMSHVCLWQKMIDDGLDYLAVFEDDIYLGENSAVFLTNDTWLKKHGLDFVKTETFLQERKITKIGIDVMDNRTVHILQEFHLGTAGYIISQKTAKDLLDYLQNISSKQMLPIDHVMFDNYLIANRLPIYQLNPAICVQEFILYPTQNHMPSDIKAERTQRKQQRPKRSLSAKIKGELSNAYRKTFGKFSRTKITYR